MDAEFMWSSLLRRAQLCTDTSPNYSSQFRFSGETKNAAANECRCVQICKTATAEVPWLVRADEPFRENLGYSDRCYGSR